MPIGAFLNPVTLGMILSGIQTIIMAAPQVKEFIVQAKAMIAALFKAGLIDKRTQDELFVWVDAQGEAALAGRIPDNWIPRPDPVD